MVKNHILTAAKLVILTIIAILPDHLFPISLLFLMYINFQHQLVQLLVVEF